MAYDEWLVKWFVENGRCTEEEIKNHMEENYFLQGYIDSFKFIILLDDINSEFGVTFENDRFQDRSFSTVKGLADAISEELAVNEG